MIKKLNNYYKPYKENNQLSINSNRINLNYNKKINSINKKYKN
jgi:hypothetical protein